MITGQAGAAAGTVAGARADAGVGAGAGTGAVPCSGDRTPELCPSLSAATPCSTVWRARVAIDSALIFDQNPSGVSAITLSYPKLGGWAVSGEGSSI